MEVVAKGNGWEGGRSRTKDSRTTVVMNSKARGPDNEPGRRSPEQEVLASARAKRKTVEHRGLMGV